VIISDIAAKADEIHKLKSQLIELTADRNMFMSGILAFLLLSNVFTIFYIPFHHSDLESFKLTMQTVADESAAATKREQAAKSDAGVLEGEIKVLKVQIDQLNSELSTARSASQAIQSHLDDQEKDQQYSRSSSSFFFLSFQHLDSFSVLTNNRNKLGNLSKTCEQLQDQLRLTQEQLDLVRAERKTLRIELDSMQSALQATSAQMAKVQSDCEAAKSEATRREKEISEANFQVFLCLFVYFHTYHSE
jgi:chromosome segregation ATPase